jgi:XTP/dITP diphosphohydrolase
MRILLATTNKGKIRELERLLDDEEFELKGLEGLPTPDDIETGSAFAENALLKAHYYHNLTGLVTVADDSGLEVEALNGSPGIYSARYGGPDATDMDRIQKLLREMGNVPAQNRNARFVCAAAVVWKGGEKVFMGEVHGTILNEPRGESGFGYDPVFYYEPFGRTFAELNHEEKSGISHRGLAFGQLVQWLRDSKLA